MMPVEGMDHNAVKASHTAVRTREVVDSGRVPVLDALPVITGAVEGARQGYRTTRSELGEVVPPHALDAALRAWRAEGERLAAPARAVALVERALHGEAFKPRL
jgi:hypothetical protein